MKTIELTNDAVELLIDSINTRLRHIDKVCEEDVILGMKISAEYRDEIGKLKTLLNYIESKYDKVSD